MRVKLVSGKSIYVDDFEALMGTIWAEKIDYSNTSIPPAIARKLRESHYNGS
jgi:hypothetical protein